MRRAENKRKKGGGEEVQKDNTSTLVLYYRYIQDKASLNKAREEPGQASKCDYSYAYDAATVSYLYLYHQPPRSRGIVQPSANRLFGLDLPVQVLVQVQYRYLRRGGWLSHPSLKPQMRLSS